MKFDFFTMGGRFLWEDVLNYQNWVIQRHIFSKKYRLLDNHAIRRESGSFENCKNTLLNYIGAYELPPLYQDSVILLHNFGRTKYSWKIIADSLKDMPANIIAINSTTLRKGLNYQANQLIQFLKNFDNQGKLYFITNGSGCLLLRKFFSICDNYRIYNIQKIIDINPINSGSDLAELLNENIFFQKILGPMLADITPKRSLSLAQLPKEISHGIIFYPPTYTKLIKKMLRRFDGFPPLSPPAERTYAEDIYTFTKYRMFPLNDKALGTACLNYLQKGIFISKEKNETKSLS